MTNWVALEINAVSFAVMVVAGYFYLRSKLARQTRDELQDLVDLRGERIETLETIVDTLRHKVDILEGQFQALQALKADEIAENVARLLRAEGLLSTRPKS